MFDNLFIHILMKPINIVIFRCVVFLFILKIRLNRLCYCVLLVITSYIFNLYLSPLSLYLSLSLSLSLYIYIYIYIYIYSISLYVWLFVCGFCVYKYYYVCGLAIGILYILMFVLYALIIIHPQICNE